MSSAAAARSRRSTSLVCRSDSDPTSATSVASTGGQRPQKAVLGEPADVVQCRGWVPAQPSGDLRVCQRLGVGEPDDPQPDRRCQGSDLGLGGGTAGGRHAHSVSD